MNIPCKLRHRSSIRRPDFLSAKFRRFGDLFRWFLHFIFWMSTIFLLPVCLTYWPRKYTTRKDPHVDNSQQAWSWYDYPLPTYSVFVCWHVTWPGDLDFCPFDLKHLSYMVGHVRNHATEFEVPKTIRSWVTSYNGSHWLALKMRPRPLRMRRITWPVSRFAYSLYNFYWATTTIKGRLLSCRPMLKPFSEIGPKNGCFWGKWGRRLEFRFRDPQKALPCAEPRRLTYFCVKIGARVSAVAFFKNPPPKKITESLCAEGREITHAQNRNP